MRFDALCNRTCKEKTSIFISSQWDTVVRLGRKKSPYVVVPLRFNQFFDLKKLANENFGYFKHTTDGKQVNWIRLRYCKWTKTGLTSSSLNIILTMTILWKFMFKRN